MKYKEKKYMDKSVDKLCVALRGIYKLPAIGELSGFLEGETAFLLTLKEYGDKPATPSFLSEDLGVTKGRITAIINSLVKKDMILLDKIEGDRRKINVRITEKGLDFINAKFAKVEGFVDEFVARVGKNKVNEFTEMLESFTAAIKDLHVENTKTTGGGA